MILSEQIEVPIAPAVTQQRLLDYLADHTGDGAASEATHDQNSTHLRAGISLVSKEVIVQTLPPVAAGERTVIPVRWTATGITGPLFPTLEANIELRPADDERTQIVLIGSYLPPLGVVGAAVDRLVLHELATATVRNFLARIAARVAHPANASGVSSSG